MGCGASQPAVDVGGAAKATASKPAAAAPKLAPTNPPTLPPPSEDAGDREWWEELMTPGTVSEFYELGKVLGRGASSVVREAHNKETRERVACKVSPSTRLQGLTNDVVGTVRARSTFQRAHPPLTILTVPICPTR